MKTAQTTRDRLTGKPLIGFDTKAVVVRAPRSKVGGEVKPRD
jgi:hypothetical protein